MECSSLTPGVFFPSDASNADQPFRFGNAQVQTNTYMYNAQVVGGAAYGSVSPVGTEVAAYRGTPANKYWVAAPIDLIYTPPGGSWSSFGSSTTVTITVNEKQYNSFFTPTFVKEYQCVGGGPVTLTPPVITNCPIFPTAISLPITFVIQNTATCSITGPASVQAGAPFTINVTFNNPVGSSTWSALTGYDVARYTNIPGLLPNPTDLPMPFAFSYPPGTGFTLSDTLTAPLNPDPGGDSYTVIYEMEQHGSLFPQPCGITFTVRRTFKYVPVISSPNFPGGTPILPADSALIAPGSTIQLQETVKNTAAGTSPGDPYNWAINVYKGPYTYPNPIAFGGDTVVSAGYDPNGVPAGGATTEPIANYTVPANTPDGTQICFFDSVTPAVRTSAANPGYDDLWGYSRFASVGGIPPDYSAFANANVRSGFNGVLANPINDMCYEVANVRTLDIQVNQGDVHSGGGVGANCNLPGGSAGTITGDTGSYAQYVASAYSTISNFQTNGGAGSGNTLTLGNAGTSGNYGTVCRPDMAAAATSYIAAHGSAGTISGLVSLNNLNGIYVATGPLFIGGTISHPVTIYCDLAHGCTGVRVVTNITYAGSATLLTLPSFGLIANDANISIDKGVSQLDGFYVAQGNYLGLLNASNTGVINTCTQHVLGQTGDCPNNLTVLGSLLANSFAFGRTGVATGIAAQVTTESITQSGLLYLAPPPAFATQPNSAYGLPQYGGEQSPLY
jgi:hypothetical protein